MPPPVDGDVFSKCERLFQQPFDDKKDVQEAYEEIELTAFMLMAEKKFTDLGPHNPQVTFYSLANVDKRNQLLLTEVRLDFTRHCNAGKNYEEKYFETESGVADLGTKCDDHLAKLNTYFQVHEKNYSEMRPKLVTALNAVYHV